MNHFRRHVMPIYPMSLFLRYLASRISERHTILWYSLISTIREACVYDIFYSFMSLSTLFYAPAFAATANHAPSWPCLKCMEHLLLFAQGFSATTIQPFQHRHKLGNVWELTLTGATFYHWRVEPKSQLSPPLCQIILTIPRHNSHNSQRTLSRIRLQVPTVWPAW